MSGGNNGFCFCFVVFVFPSGTHFLAADLLQVVELGRYDIDTWYYSPYPEPFASEKKLYICEYTLKYFKKKKTLVRHLAKTPLRHPPGDEIYRSPDPGHYPGDCATTPTIAVFEVSTV